MMHRVTLISLLFLFCSLGVRAAEVQVPEWKVSIASGYGILENPISGKQDGETYFLPSFSYYGKRFFISDLTVGYTLLEEERFYIDVIARPNEDGIFYKLGDSTAITTGSISSYLVHNSPAAPSVDDLERKVSVVAGPSVTLVSDFADVSFSWLHDISQVHYGSESHISIDKQYPLFGGVLGFGIGAVKKDADLVNYYYHFSESEAQAFYLRYLRSNPVDDVTDRYARLQFSYPLSKRLELRLAARYSYFDLDGRHEQFIEDPETLSWFAGVQYTVGSGR
ncbi:MipA/OmpV family protein [Microbulbifer sp. SA54]|uniref:MipA/OmpV family protein n=1 Tax=Microbulbifer sp. SA54 TaxID=3401577 RepID=UPI003AAB5571